MNLNNNRSERLKIIKAVIPIFAYNLINFSFTIVDSIMISVEGVASLGGVGQAGIYFNVIMVFFLGLLGIFTPLVSKNNLIEDKKFFIPRFFSTLILCLFLSLIVIVIFSFTEKIFMVFNQPTETTVVVLDYLSIIQWSVFSVLFYHVFVQTTYIINKARIIIVSVIVGNVINIFLNWIFIYQLDMGVTGVATGTVIVRVLMLLMVGVFLFRSLKFNMFELKYIKLDVTFLKSILLKGGPRGLTSLNDWLASFLLVLFVGWSGAISVASNQVADVISSLMYMLPQAFCVVLTIELSKNFGDKAKDLMDFKQRIKQLFKIIIPLNTSIIVIFYVLLPLLIGMFSIPEEAFTMSRNIMLVHLSFFIFYSFQFFFLSVLDSMLDTLYSSVVSILTTYMFVLPLGYWIASNNYPPTYIWIIDGFGNIILSFLLFVRIKKLTNKKNNIKNSVVEGRNYG